MEVLAVIPARYASTRFPGKPLVEIAGRPMVQHVYEKCLAVPVVSRVIIGTEDGRIVQACRAFASEVELTSPQLASGTDRVAEVASRHPEYDAVLNVQGDEPGIEPETVDAVVGMLARPGVEIASAMTRFLADESAGNPNSVKVVTDSSGKSLYFSRSVIPFSRDTDGQSVVRFRHLGIYGFRRDVLMALSHLSPSRLERAESLEQLRWLEAGYSIYCAEVQSRSRGIDTPDDLETYIKAISPQIKSVTP